MNEFEQSLPMMIYRTLDQVMPPFRHIYAQFNLTEPQWRVLRVLWESDGDSMQQISDATLISAPSLVGVVDRLVKANFVEKRHSQSDRRKVHVHLTLAGTALENEVSPAVQSAYQALEAKLSKDQWQSLYNSLNILANS